MLYCAQKKTGEGIPQGQLRLSPYASKDFEQKIDTPAATTPLHGNAVYAWMVFEERENEAFEPSHILTEVFVSDMVHSCVVSSLLCSQKTIDQLQDNVPDPTVRQNSLEFPLP